MLAGEADRAALFDDVRRGLSGRLIALALILFDGGLRTRLTTFRSVLAPAATLATVGVMITAALAAPVARYLLDMSWSEAAGGCGRGLDRCRGGVLPGPCPRLAPAPPASAPTLEVESGSNDPFAVLLTVLLVE